MSPLITTSLLALARLYAGEPRTASPIDPTAILQEGKAGQDGKAGQEGKAGQDGEKAKPADGEKAKPGEGDKAKEDNKVKAHVADNLLFRHWNAWDEGTRSHLFVVGVDGGEPRDLTLGAKYDVPPGPFGGSAARSTTSPAAPAVRAWPASRRKWISPATMRPGRSTMPRMERAVTLLPHPLSPTMPSVDRA